MEIQEIRDYWKGIVSYGYKTGYFDIQYKLDKGILYFSAANSFTDILTDLRLYSKKAFLERCEGTFYEILMNNRCYDSLLYETSPKNIHTVVGYSLGGAFAVAFASLFKKREFKVVTFGCPLMPRGFKIDESNMYRIVYGSDLVTKIPLFNKSFGKRLDFGVKGMIHCIRDHNDKRYGSI